MNRKMVPLVPHTPPPEFGELKASSEFHDTAAMNGDLTYVPGFSEMRYRRDQAINDVRAGRLPANEVPTLPYNFRWARCQNKKGDPDSRKVVRAGNRGYKTVTREEVGEGKLLKELPAGAVFAADGSIRLGDTQLMIAPADRVARNEFNKRSKTESVTRGIEGGFEAALKEVGGRPSAGANPFISKEVGKPVELAPKPKK